MPAKFVSTLLYVSNMGSSATGPVFKNRCQAVRLGNAVRTVAIDALDTLPVPHVAGHPGLAFDTLPERKQFFLGRLPEADLAHQWNLGRLRHHELLAWIRGDRPTDQQFDADLRMLAGFIS